MEKKRRKERGIEKSLSRLIAPIILGLSLILTACVPKDQDIILPNQPPIESTSIHCKYYTGSSSFDRLGEYLFQKYEGEKTRDESRGYSIITMKDLNGNMVVFITKSGAMVNFVSNIVVNQENLSMLPCNPSQVVEINILIGGNNETDTDIPTNGISNELTQVSKTIVGMYPKADLNVYLPYITPQDDSQIRDRRNAVDTEVIAGLQGVKRITVIPLTPYVISEAKIKDYFFSDPLHMKPERLLEILGGQKAVFSFSKN